VGKILALANICLVLPCKTASKQVKQIYMGKQARQADKVLGINTPV